MIARFRLKDGCVFQGLEFQIKCTYFIVYMIYWIDSTRMFQMGKKYCFDKIIKSLTTKIEFNQLIIKKMIQENNLFKSQHNIIT